MPRVGYLSVLSPASDRTRSEAFRQGLRELGYVDGQNIGIEARYAEGDLKRLPGLASELVSLKPDGYRCRWLYCDWCDEEGHENNSHSDGARQRSR